MEKVLKALAFVGVLGAVGWFFSQLGGEPRFAKYQGVGEGAGRAVGAPGVGLPGLGIPGTGSKKGQPTGEGVAPPTFGPTLGPPPINPDADDPSIEDQPVYLVDKDLSRFASKTTVPFTRIRQILIGAGHTDVAKQVSEHQSLLREVRRGEEPGVELLASEQEAVVIEIGKVLTGPEVDELLEELRSQLVRLQEAEAAKADP